MELLNGESLALAHVPSAHTDTDIYVHYEKANVLHVGDLFFNGFYPYIDGGTGGSIKSAAPGTSAGRFLHIHSRYQRRGQVVCNISRQPDMMASDKLDLGGLQFPRH